jgi:hypothetical protein
VSAKQKESKKAQGKKRARKQDAKECKKVKASRAKEKKHELALFFIPSTQEAWFQSPKNCSAGGKARVLSKMYEYNAIC